MNITRKESPNFTKGRQGQKVLGVVVHVTEGSLSSVDSWFGSEKSRVSAHYCVGKRGEVHQYVQESDTAWHAGRVDRPTAKLVVDRPGVNPNLFTVGIEFEGNGREDFTERQYLTGALLIALVAHRHGFRINPETVVGHHSIFSKKSCPGPINLPKLVKMAQLEAGQVGEVVDPKEEAPSPGAQRYSAYWGSNITLVHYVDDRKWYFTVNADPLKHGIQMAGTAWSTMPAAH